MGAIPYSLMIHHQVDGDPANILIGIKIPILLADN